MFFYLFESYDDSQHAGCHRGAEITCKHVIRAHSPVVASFSMHLVARLSNVGQQSSRRWWWTSDLACSKNFSKKKWKLSFLLFTRASKKILTVKCEVNEHESEKWNGKIWKLHSQKRKMMSSDFQFRVSISHPTHLLSHVERIFCFSMIEHWNI